MTNFTLLSARSLDLRCLKWESNAEQDTFVTCETIFDSQPSVQAWLNTLMSNWKGFSNLQNLKSPIAFILPETLVINLALQVSKNNQHLSLLQQISRSLTKDFGIQSRQVAFKYHKISENEYFDTYWVSLISKRLWTSIREIINPINNTNCFVFPPILGHMTYFQKVCQKTTEHPIVGVFLEKNLTRFFLNNDKFENNSTSHLDFLDLRKVTSSKNSQILDPEIHMTTRYFSHNLQVQENLKKVIVFSEQDDFYPALKLLGEDVPIQFVQEIDSWPRDNSGIGVSEKALFLGILDVLKSEETCRHFDFMSFKLPSLETFFHIFLLRGLGWKCTLFLLLISSTFLGISIAKKTKACQKIQTQLAQYSTAESDLQALKTQCQAWQQLKEERCDMESLIQDVKKSFTSLNCDMCIDKIRIEKTKKKANETQCEVHGRYRPQANEISFEKQLAAQFSSENNSNIHISVNPKTAFEYEFVCKFTL